MSGLIYERELCQQWEFIVSYISCLLVSSVCNTLLWERTCAKCMVLSESGVTHLPPQALNTLIQVGFWQGIWLCSFLIRYLETSGKCLNMEISLLFEHSSIKELKVSGFH